MDIHAFVAGMEKGLATYATPSTDARRSEKEEPASTSGRTEFQRDRDRIVHSKAFRRLAHKTQVFTSGEGDHVRTRLTHSLEVAEIARGIGRLLALNESLIEAIALGHDLGHTPFGHAGEAALNDLLSDEAGFNHAVQGVRVVDSLEVRQDARGLNLTWQVREGILKHGADLREIEGKYPDLSPSDYGSLEAQVVSIADKIAYTCADWEDADRTGVFTDMVKAHILSQSEIEERLKEFGSDATRGYSGIINTLVLDVYRTSLEAIKGSGLKGPDDARHVNMRVIQFGAFEDKFAELRKFLGENVYRSSKASASDSVGKRIIRGLFEELRSNPASLPLPTRHRFAEANRLPAIQGGLVINGRRVLADHISGMTDRYAQDRYRELYL